MAGRQTPATMAARRAGLRSRVLGCEHDAASASGPAATADPREAEPPTRCVAGGISPLGRRERIRRLVDAGASAHATIFVSAGRTPVSDPLRMYLVVRRGAVAELARAGELAGAAAVACVREPAFADAVAAWRPRPGKVCLRARSDGQWRQVLEEPHALAGDALAALPPRRRSERGPLLERLQAMSTDLGAAPRTAPDLPGALTYLLNPEAPMSSGKTLAQIAHAAVMAADTGRFEDWIADRCPARVLMPSPRQFAAAAARDDLAACVADAGLTEVAPGTVTVIALAP